MIKAGIIGGAGYVGGELIRLLIHHPDVFLSYVVSTSQSDKTLYDVHHDLLGLTEMRFKPAFRNDIDVLFICSGHGKSKEFLEKNTVDTSIKIIDLSTDFRIENESHDFVYGLCELNKLAIKNATRIANCGCYATCIQLGLLPAVRAKLINSDIHVNAITGSTGAGQANMDTSHFSWRNNNISVYKPFQHQHLSEIVQSLKQENRVFEHDINFIPVRGDFTRGIFASMYFECDSDEKEVLQFYHDYYIESPFVHVSERNIALKEVVNTNMCYIHIEKIGNKILIISIIDNLLKGAAGQAVQNMNLAFGLDETTGLLLKATAF